MKKILLAGWLLWCGFSLLYLGKYFRVSKKFLSSPDIPSWRIWSTKNKKVKIIFPNQKIENLFKKYLPPGYKLSPVKKPKGKFLFLNGTNGWHHLSKKFLDDFYSNADFTLVLIDAHPDAAPNFKEQKINCGNWINFIRRPIMFLGGSVGFDEEINRFLNPELIARNQLKIYSAKNFSFYLKSPKMPPDSFRRIVIDKVATFLGSSGYYVSSYSLNDFYQKEPTRKKIYLTIDLDVLNSRFIHTDFGTGLLSLEELLKLLDFLNSKNEIIGIDICGISPNSDDKSRKTWEKIFFRISRYLNI